jgi:hypothetical protein
MKKITFLITLLLTITLSFGQDLLTDGGFEGLSTGDLTNSTNNGVWAATSTGTAVQDNQTNSHTGTFSVNLGNDFHNLRQYFTGVPNEDYTVSFWYKITNANVDPTDAPYVAIKTQAGPANGNGEVIDTYSYQLDETVTTWTNYTFTFTTIETAIQINIFSPDRSDKITTDGDPVNVNNAVRFDDISIVPTSSLSISNLAKFNFNTYPNPAKDYINLSAAKNIDKIEIYSLLGQQVKSIPLNSNSAKVNVSGLSKGVYLVKTFIEDAVGTYKFIKE